jgi:hypothetical protein
MREKEEVRERERGRKQSRYRKTEIEEVGLVKERVGGGRKREVGEGEFGVGIRKRDPKAVGGKYIERERGRRRK